MTYADDARTIFTDMLGTLEKLVDKAEAAGMDDAILAAKLAEDMFPLETQFRIAINQVAMALGRTCASELPLDEDAYVTLAQVRARIGAIRGEVDKATADCWTAPDSEIDYTLPNGMRFVLSAQQYVRDWMLPNFYFHTTMAYAILRHEGLDLGKVDFVGHMMRYARAPADAG